MFSYLTGCGRFWQGIIMEHTGSQDRMFRSLSILTLQPRLAFCISHQDNMSMCFIPPYTPLLYSKIAVYRTLFSNFYLKTYIVGTH